MYRQCSVQDDKYNKVLPLKIGCEDCKSEHSFGPAVRVYWLVHYVISGKGTYTVNDKVYEVKEGQAFLIKPGEVTVYTADKDEPWVYVWAGFSSNVDTLNDLPYVLEDEELGAIFTKIYEEFDFISGNQVYAITKIWEIFGILAKNSLISDDKCYINRAIDIIKNQYMHDISIASIAQQLNLDRSYFSNIFKARMGISPSNYITNYRMHRAMALLRLNKYSISVVATSVGYTDPFSFSRSFKKFYGVPPQKYKEISPTSSHFTFELPDGSNI